MWPRPPACTLAFPRMIYLLSDSVSTFLTMPRLCHNVTYLLRFSTVCSVTFPLKLWQRKLLQRGLFSFPNKKWKSSCQLLFWYKDTVNNKLLNVLSSPTCRHKKHKNFKPLLQIVFLLQPTTLILTSLISRQKEGNNFRSLISFSIRILGFEMVNYIPHENYNV